MRSHLAACLSLFEARRNTSRQKIPSQVNGKVIRERAAQLRSAGQAQVKRHLEDQVGKEHHVLMENPHMGRTEQFTEVSFAEPQPEGQIISARITGADSQQLIAVAL